MVQQKIKAAGLKATPQRVAIYEIMQELCHAPINMIIDMVQQRGLAMTVSTIYRVLDTFCEAGVLSKVSHPDGKLYYDINTHDHHHMFSNSDKIVDIEDEELNEFIRQKLAERLGNCERIDKITIQIVTSTIE